MKKGVVIGLFVLGLVVAGYLASAEVFVGQPDGIYSAGDYFNISVTLSQDVQSNAYLIVSLVCDNNKVDIYKSPVNIASGSQKSTVVSANLDKSIIGELEGNCYLEAEYNGEVRRSQNFQISKRVNVQFNSNGALFNPGDRVVINGYAMKVNGQGVVGFFEVNVEGINATMVEKLHDGAFNYTFNIPSNARARGYIVNVRAYEKSPGGEITNEGNASIDIGVKQVVKTVDVALSYQNVSPGNEFLYTPVVYDQAGDEVMTDVSLEIQRPDGSTFMKRLGSEGDAQSVYIGYNYTPGYWKISAKSGNIGNTRNFYVNEYQNVSFSLINDTLYVVNTGNVPYNKPIEVTIGDTKELKEISLEVGETKRLRLLAPDGEYAIGVSDGQSSMAFGSTMLTGRAISVDELSGLVTGKSLMWVWMVVILLVLLAVVYYYRKTPSRNYTHGPSLFSSAAKLRSNSDRENIIEKGEKGKYIVAAIKIKNMDNIGKDSPALGVFDRIESVVKTANGWISNEGESVVVILQVGADKESKVAALNSLASIEKMLKDYNRRFANKVVFGIGVHYGDVVIESGGEKFKYTSWGNTVPFAKKLAELAKSELLMSEPIHFQLAGKIRVEQVQGSNAWRLKGMIERNHNSPFIEKFMKRQEEQQRREKLY